MAPVSLYSYVYQISVYYYLIVYLCVLSDDQVSMIPIIFIMSIEKCISYLIILLCSLSKLLKRQICMTISMLYTYIYILYTYICVCIDMHVFMLCMWLHIFTSGLDNIIVKCVTSLFYYVTQRSLFYIFICQC